MNGDIETRREILLGARIRFSPVGANVRSKAICSIIKQNLACLTEKESLTETQLGSLLCFSDHNTVLRQADIQDGLRVLHSARQVIEIQTAAGPAFRLSPSVAREVIQVKAECERRNDFILSSLFSTAQGGASAYSDAFFKLLASIFSRLSQAYVQSITMGGGSVSLADHRLLEELLAFHGSSVPDASSFARGVKRFFRETCPSFDQLKWNMAQNYYVARALGSDASAELLSKEGLRGAQLFCDTNILIAGLSPTSRHHNSFIELSKSCKGIGMTLCTAFVTVSELRRVAQYHGTMLKHTIDRIPDPTKQKVKDFLLESYIEEKNIDPELDVDTFINRYDSSIEQLEKLIEVSVIDSEEFDTLADDSATKSLADDLVKLYLTTRFRKKHLRSALHDAILIQHMRAESRKGRQSWIVTLDTSLATWRSQQQDESCNVITLDALLQWLAPMAQDSTDEDRLAEIFSDSLRFQILPQDVFIDLRDFQIFAEMEIETGQLPAEDVEACISEIHKAGASLDPSQPSDREKIALIVQRHFADPGTKYKKEIQDLTTYTKDLTCKLNDEVDQRKVAEQTLDQVKDQLDKTNLRLNEEERRRSTAEDRILQLEEYVRVNDEKAQHEEKRRTALRFAILGLLLFIIIEAIIVIVISAYSTGNNLFQKMTNSWHWLALGVSTTLLLFCLIFGGYRTRLIKWWIGGCDGQPPKQ